MGLAAGLGAAGTMVGAFGQYEGMQAQSAMAAYQAQVARYNAQLAMVTASRRSADAQNAAVASSIETGRLIGAKTAAFGASNIDVKGPGSAQDVIRGMRTTGMQHAMFVRSQGMQQAEAAQDVAWSQRAQAQLDQYQSSVLSELAPFSLLGGGLKAGGQLFSGGLMGA